MLKTLAKNVNGYKLVSILTPVFIILEVILEAFIVYITKDLINLMNPEEGQAISNITEIVPIAIQLVVMAVLSLTCGIANGITGAKASAGFAANLRKNVFYKIQDFSFELVRRKVHLQKHAKPHDRTQADSDPDERLPG